jgi:hypothetical protein
MENTSTSSASEFLIELDGKFLPPSYSNIEPNQWKKALSTFKKIGKKHGVSFKLTGKMSFNPNYKTFPAFKTQLEAQNLESELKSSGFDCYIMDVQPDYWG